MVDYEVGFAIISKKDDFFRHFFGQKDLLGDKIF